MFRGFRRQRQPISSRILKHYTSNCAAYDVSNTSDGASPGPTGSLRKAISDLNAGGSPAVIRFLLSPNSQITLTAGSLPSIAKSVVITSTNVAGIKIDGNNDSGDGLVFAESTVQGSTVNFLTIQHFSGKGVVISAGTNEPVTLLSCTVQNNTQGGISITSNAHQPCLTRSFNLMVALASR